MKSKVFECCGCGADGESDERWERERDKTRWDRLLARRQSGCRVVIRGSRGWIVGGSNTLRVFRYQGQSILQRRRCRVRMKRRSRLERDDDCGWPRTTAMASRIIRRADRWEGGWGEIGGKAVEEDGRDSKWEEGAADSGIRGLMSNDGGRGRTGWQRAAGTPIPCQRVHASHGRRRKRSQQLESAPLDWPPSKRAERGPGSKQHGSPRKGYH